METRSRKQDALLGLLIIGVVGLFLWLSFAVGGGSFSGARSFVLLFDNAAGLHEDNVVTIAGVQIGRVDQIDIEGKLANVRIAIRPDVKLYANAQATIRAKSLLGEKYVDLVPGEPPAPELPVGARIEQNPHSVDIDELIRGVSTLVTSLNTIVPPLEAAVTRFDQVLAGTDGEEAATELTRTIAATGDLIRQTSALLGDSSDDLRAIVKLTRAKGPDALENLAAASKRLDRLLSVLDPDALQKAAERVQPTVTNLNQASVDLKNAMGDIKAASTRFDGLVRKLDRALTRMEQIDERAIREFLQKEGVRVNLIPDSNVEKRLERLRERDDRP